MIIFIALILYFLGAFLGYQYTAAVDPQSIKRTRFVFAAGWFLLAAYALGATVKDWWKNRDK